MPVLVRDDGVRLYYEIHDSGGRGTPLILTHGFGATTRMWDPNLPELSADRPVLVHDLRGHGRSDSPEDPALYGEDVAVADIEALLDFAGWDRAVIGGMSLGGYLTLAFHRVHPGRCAALLLVDTGPGYKKDASREAWNERAVAMGRRMAAETRDGPGTAETRTAHHENPVGLERAGRYTLTQRDDRVMRSLPSIAVPALVVVGEQDDPYRNAAEYMATRIPGARQVVIPNAGHAANMDQPSRFNEEAGTFLKNL